MLHLTAFTSRMFHLVAVAKYHLLISWDHLSSVASILSCWSTISWPELLEHDIEAWAVGTRYRGVSCWNTISWPELLEHAIVAWAVGTRYRGLSCWTMISWPELLERDILTWATGTRYRDLSYWNATSWPRRYSGLALAVTTIWPRVCSWYS